MDFMTDEGCRSWWEDNDAICDFGLSYGSSILGCYRETNCCDAGNFYGQYTVI